MNTNLVSSRFYDSFPNLLAKEVNFKKDFTVEEVVSVIVGVNKGEKYWYQETRSMQNPKPNMGPPGPTTFSDVTSDEYREELIYEPFLDFILKSVEAFPSLFFYLHESPFGFHLVFGVRYLNPEFENPYLIKFKERHLSASDYLRMVKILYSPENTNKYLNAGMEKIKKLSFYSY